MDSIENKLRAWARWSRNSIGATGYTSIWEAIERNAPLADTKATVNRTSSEPPMSDDEAAKIDRAVCRMKKSAPVFEKIIRKWYLSNNNEYEIARYYLTPLEYPQQASMPWGHKDKLRVDPKIVNQLLRAAIEIVELELSLIESEINEKKYYDQRHK